MGLGFEREARGATQRLDEADPTPDRKRRLEKVQAENQRHEEQGEFHVCATFRFSDLRSIKSQLQRQSHQLSKDFN